MAATEDIMEKNMTEVSSVSMVRGLDENGNSVLVAPEKLRDQMKCLYTRILIPRIDKGPYLWLLSHRISAGGYTSFEFISPPFSDMTEIRSVHLSVFMYNNPSIPSPVISVKTSGGKSHPMNNNNCSLAYEKNGDSIDVYLPINQYLPITCLDKFYERTTFLSESYSLQEKSNLNLIPIGGI